MVVCFLFCLALFREVDGQDGYVTVDGDILVPAVSVRGSSSLAPTTWPGCVVPYEFESGFPSDVRLRFLKATEEWVAKLPCCSFRPREASDASYARIASGATASTCSSEVGRNPTGGPTVVALGSDCSSGSITHEVGHVLGLRHENTRFDANSYVEYRAANVMPAVVANFAVAQRATMLGPYDYASIMHYGSHAFTRNGKTTLAAPVDIGQRETISDGDAAAVRTLYGSACPAAAPFGCVFSVPNPLILTPNFATSVHVTPIGGTMPYTFTLQSPTTVTGVQTDQTFSVTIPSEAAVAGTTIVVNVEVASSSRTARCSTTLKVGMSAVCFGVEGRGGCSNHGTCIGAAAAGSPLLQCECDAGFARGRCDYEVGCTTPRLREPLAAQREGLQAYGSFDRISHDSADGVGHAVFTCDSTAPTAYFIEWFSPPGQSFVSVSFWCAASSGDSQCWFEAVHTTSPLTQLVSFEVVGSRAHVNGEDTGILFPTDEWTKVTLTVEYGAVVKTVMALALPSGEVVTATAGVGEGDYDALSAYAVSIGCRGVGVTRAREVVASCTPLDPARSDVATGPSSFVPSGVSMGLPSAVDSEVGAGGNRPVGRSGVVTGVCGTTCSDEAISSSGDALIAMLKAQAPDQEVVIVSAKCVPCGVRRGNRQASRTLPQVVWDAKCTTVGACQRVCDVTRSSPGALPFFSDSSSVTCSEATGAVNPPPAVDANDDLSDEAWFTLLMVMLPLAALGLLVGLCLCLVVYVLYATRVSPAAGGKERQPRRHVHTGPDPEGVFHRDIGRAAAVDRVERILAAPPLSPVGASVDPYAGWPSVSYSRRPM